MEQKTSHRRTRDRRVEMNVEGLKDDYAWHLRYTLAKVHDTATSRDQYTAFAHCVRDRMVERWIETQATHHDQNVHL